MEGVKFLRPARGVDVPTYPTDPEFFTMRSEYATLIRQLVEECDVVRIADANTLTRILPGDLGDDDTAWPAGPVMVRDKGSILELEMDSQFRRISEGILTPAEPIVLPIHATSVFFCASHDRSDSYFCTAIITCEDESLLAGEPEHPFFVWINHPVNE